jgi:hypothetical protein
LPSKDRTLASSASGPHGGGKRTSLDFATQSRAVEPWLERAGFHLRLPEQPIFYPVLSEQQVVMTARDWNVGRGSTSRCPFASRQPKPFGAFLSHSGSSIARRDAELAGIAQWA